MHPLSYAHSLLAAALVLAPVTAHAALTPEQTQQLLQKLDDMDRRDPDYKVLVHLEFQAKDRPMAAYEAVSYSRNQGTDRVLVFTSPKAQQGKGYLILDRNIWFYDATVGKWERRIERERLMGSTARRSDLDPTHYVDRYTAVCERDEQLGSRPTHVLLLTQKPDQNLEFPQSRIWVDTDTLNVLKREDLTLSGKKARTVLYTKWQKAAAPGNQRPLLFAQETHYFDELEQGVVSKVFVKGLDLNPIHGSTFTKAWLEGKSR